jgi:hypothetical protein
LGEKIGMTRVFDKEGNLVCVGINCLLDGTTKTNVNATVNGVNKTFDQFTNGTVLDDTGKTICTSGGSKCLSEYVNNNTVSKVVEPVNGKNETFNVKGDGTVTNENGT